MRILVTGSRDWTDRRAVYRAIVELQLQHAEKGYDGDGNFVDWLTDGWVIVHGACPTGADAIADDFAVTSFITVERHPADWDKHGKAAGPLRNQEMVDLGADICLAFPLGESRGTRDCMRRAEAAGIKVVEVPPWT